MFTVVHQVLELVNNINGRCLLRELENCGTVTRAGVISKIRCG
jgi:hypothetical protein